MDYQTEISSLDEKCLQIIEKAMSEPTFDKQAFVSWVEAVSPSSKRNPSAYFHVAFRGALSDGKFYKEPTAAEPIRQPSVQQEDPPNIAEEIALERKGYEEILAERKHILETLGVQMQFTEPNDPRFDEHPSVFDGPYLGHLEYKANTYISVKREADADGTSMHEICRRKHLIYEMLIF